MKPGLRQQALIALVVAVVVAATLMGGFMLTLSDTARASVPLAGDISPVATSYRIPTLAPTGIIIEPTHVSGDAPAVATVAVPTDVPTSLPTRTLVPSRPTATAPAVSGAKCQPPAGWVLYTIRPGDTLFRIGLRYGLTVTELAKANCLTSTAITVGSRIYVPPITPIAMPTLPPSAQNPLQAPPGPIPTGTQTATDGACTNRDSTITTPKVGAILRGVVSFMGTARSPDFTFYKLEVRQEWVSSASDYVTFFTGYSPVSNGLLSTLDTRSWPDGEYWIRLVVVDSTGNYPERCAILYVFDN